MLLRECVVALGKEAAVQLLLQVGDPGGVEVVEDPRVNAGPVVNGHGEGSRWSLRSRTHSSPCLGCVDVSPWRIRVEFPDCHYITVSSPVGGDGGFNSPSFSAFRTRRASGQPPLTP